jgi:hypothetical protein
MKLYLDDMRDHPEGWTRAYTADHAKNILGSGEIEFASLDHDLDCYYHSSYDMGVETGYHVVRFMVENDIWPHLGVRIHTDNDWGRKNMQSLIETYSPYENMYEGRARTWQKHGISPSEGDIVIYK